MREAPEQEITGLQVLEGLRKNVQAVIALSAILGVVGVIGTSIRGALAEQNNHKSSLPPFRIVCKDKCRWYDADTGDQIDAAWNVNSGWSWHKHSVNPDLGTK